MPHLWRDTVRVWRPKEELSIQSQPALNTQHYTLYSADEAAVCDYCGHTLIGVANGWKFNITDCNEFLKTLELHRAGDLAVSSKAFSESFEKVSRCQTFGRLP